MERKSNIKPIVCVVISAVIVLAVMCGVIFTSQPDKPNLLYRPQERIPMVTIDRSQGE